MPAPRSLCFLSRILAVLFLAFLPVSLFADTFVQTNLVSDIPGKAVFTDPNLIDPWGASFTATGPFWISDNGSNVTTLYNGAGVINPLVVSVPGGPTGQVNNGNAAAFVLSDNKSANFIFDTQAGTLAAWNSGLGTAAAIVASTAGASYTGLAIGNSGVNTYLYAANASGGINVFNTSFQPVTLPGGFVDPNLPAGYVPYNIQLLGSQLYVTYVQYNAQGNEIPSGIVDVFSTAGVFINRFSSSSLLDAPWGITVAPLTFGVFGGDILVGNFLNGQINAFDPVTGFYLGTLDGANNQPIADPGLWALDFRTGGTGNNTNALYFTAGINNEKDGLFGAITVAPTPEPATLILDCLGMAALAVAGLRKKFA